MTEPMTCDDCGAVVELHKAYAGVLEVTCECDETRSVKVASMLPKGWSA